MADPDKLWTVDLALEPDEFQLSPIESCSSLGNKAHLQNAACCRAVCGHCVGIIERAVFWNEPHSYRQKRVFLNDGLNSCVNVGIKTPLCQNFHHVHCVVKWPLDFCK